MNPLIVANWKMNPQSLVQARNLFARVQKGTKGFKNVEVAICPPFCYLSSLKANGAQDVFWKNSGPFTGEISPKQLKDLACQYVLVGHSERRRRLKETGTMIRKKVKAAKAAGLAPIFCVENASQAKEIKNNTILAFEPVFAIGTGKPCSVKKAKKAREQLARFSKVLYGGSVGKNNAREYIQKAGFQGLLVGAASLKPDDFIKLVRDIDSLK